jgi:hypothetical protein
VSIVEENKKRFILYEYLVYFWKKKFYFIIVPLLTAILSVGIVYLLKYDGNYKVTATVFTGALDYRHELTDTELLEKQYEKINTSIKVEVHPDNYLRFTLIGENKDQLIEDVKEISGKSYNALYKDAQDKLKDVNEKETEYESLNADVKLILNEHKDNILSLEDSEDKYYALAELISAQTDILYTLNKIENAQDFFEEPQKLGLEIQPPKTYWKESTIVGILVGLVLTVGLLMLMKYIEEARRNYRHD